jgi:hypothetical protein
VRTAFVRSQDRKRTAISWGSALLLYAAVAGAFWIAGLLKTDALSAYSGPIMVRIGSPEGVDETSTTLPAAPRVTAQPAAPAPAAPAVAPPTAAPSTPAVAPTPATPGGVQAAPQTAPSETAPPATTAEAEAISGAGTMEAPSSTAGSPLGSGSVTLKGSEQGNSFQTSYDSGSGKIGRSLYVPIYLYMPLPQIVEKTLYAAIPASRDGLQTTERRKLEFRDLYEQSGDTWRLKSQPSFDARPGVWIMLGDAGYPMSKADYKTGKNLKPVVLKFRVSASLANQTPTLLAVEVASSSGYSELDDAVIFGFRQAAFFNASNLNVSGEFTYWFQ